VSVLLPIGFGVGALTGLVWVGGGFVIVPALIVGLSFGVREAMATSMEIVAAVSVFGLVAHLASGSSLDLPVAVAIGGAAVIGAAGGRGSRTASRRRFSVVPSQCSSRWESQSQPLRES